MWEQARCSWHKLQSVKRPCGNKPGAADTNFRVWEGKLPLVAGSALIISLNQDPVLSQVVGLKPRWPRGNSCWSRYTLVSCRPCLLGMCSNISLIRKKIITAKKRRVMSPSLSIIISKASIIVKVLSCLVHPSTPGILSFYPCVLHYASLSLWTLFLSYHNAMIASESRGFLGTFSLSNIFW